MIMTIVEGGGKLSRGASAAVFAILAYVVAASLAAAFGNIGSGLLVLAMGGVTIAIVDYVMWQDAATDAETSKPLGPYVLRGPEVSDEPGAVRPIGHFDPIRREGPAEAPIAPAPAPVVVAPVAEPTPAEPVTVEVATAEPTTSEQTTPAAEADAVGARPAGIDAPRDGVADKLERINGIGPANKAKLNAMGIWHFDQIAAWDDEQVRWMGAYLAFPGRIEREDWVGQARAIVAPQATSAPVGPSAPQESA